MPRCTRARSTEKPKAEKVEFVQVKKDEPPPPKEEPKPPPPEVVMKAPPPKGFQVLTAPIKIPDVLPDIDLSKKVTNEEDFSGKGVAGGIAKGVVGGTPHRQRQPDLLRVPGRKAGRRRTRAIRRRGIPTCCARRTSKAKCSLSSWSTRRAGPTCATFKVLKSTHDLFTNAVKAALPNMKFYPAEVGGKKVKQLVQMPFQFSLTKSE